MENKIKGHIGAAAIMMLTCTAFGMTKASAVAKPEHLEVTGQYTYTGEEITVKDEEVTGYDPKEMNMAGNKSSKVGDHEISVTPKEGNWDNLDNADAVTAPWKIEPAEQVISLISGKGANAETSTIKVAQGENISAEEMQSKITGAKGELQFTPKKNFESSTEESETINDNIGTLGSDGKFTGNDKQGEGEFEVFAKPVYKGDEESENTHIKSNTLNVKLQVLQKAVIEGLEKSEKKFTYNQNAQAPKGTITVSEGTISPDELEVLYEGTGETKYPLSKDTPTNAGTYKVTYSVPNTNETYAGSTSYNFEIAKATPEPTSLPADLRGVKGQKLGTVEIGANWEWKNPEMIMDEEGEHSFDAVFIPNDTINYTNYESRVSVKVSGTEVTDNYPEKPTLSVEGKYIYNGNDQVADVKGYDYKTMTISGHVERNAGTYDISIKPIKQWSDGTTDEVMVSWTIEKANAENIKIPTNLTATRNQRLGEINLPEGFIWLDPDTEISQTDAYYASFTPNGDTVNYNTVNDIYVMVKLIDPNIKNYELDDSQDKSLVFNKNSKIQFKINADYDLFADDGGKLFIDGLFVNPDNYSSEPGSTVITLSQPFADSLSLGSHTLTATFRDGAETNLSFSVKDQNSDPSQNVNNTDSSDNNVNDSDDSFYSNLNQNLLQSFDDDSSNIYDFIQTDDSFSFFMLSLSFVLSSCSIALLRFFKRFSTN